jgi:hypothetical protein
VLPKNSLIKVAEIKLGTKTNQIEAQIAQEGSEEMRFCRVL